VSEELKITMVIVIGVLALAVVGSKGCNHYHEIDANAPVVETCVKHPVSSSPFYGR
jgi:hypothetical protein